jgi:hypothetical protein
MGSGVRHVHRSEQPVGHVGTHWNHPQSVVDLDVSEIAAGTGDETRVLGPLDRCSEDGPTHGRRE